MDKNVTSHTAYRISGLSSPGGRVFAIRDRMPGFHKDSRNPRVSPDIAMQHKMNTTRTNAYENERKRTSRGGPYPPTIIRGSNTSANPGQNGGFSDGFLIK